jgi:hypothetical protein
MCAEPGALMRALICSAILFALAVARPAYAQDEVQKSETEFYVQTSGGTAQACGMEYTIAYIDRNRNGNAAGVKGSLSWVEANGRFSVGLLIRGFDFNATMTPIPFSVFQGFVVIDGKSVLPNRPLKGDQPTDFFAGYSIENSMAMVKF